jgi:hypothetical protein
MKAQIVNSQPNLGSDPDPSTFSPLAVTSSFHGVDLGGTFSAPTITNNTPKPVYGFVLEKRSTTIPYHRLDANGQMIVTTDYVHTHNVFASDSIAFNGGIKPGETVSVGFLVMGVISSGLDPVTGAEVPEGEPVGYNLTGVLFSDGTFYGSDDDFARISESVNLYRSYARDTQYRENRVELLIQERSRPRFPEKANASFNPRTQALRSLAAIFMAVNDQAGQEEMDKSIARLASIPDLVKGQ